MFEENQISQQYNRLILNRYKNSTAILYGKRFFVRNRAKILPRLRKSQQHGSKCDEKKPSKIQIKKRTVRRIGFFFRDLKLWIKFGSTLVRTSFLWKRKTLTSYEHTTLRQSQKLCEDKISIKKYRSINSKYQGSKFM